MNRNEFEDMFLPFVQRHVNIQKIIRLFWNGWSMIFPVHGIKIMDEKWDYLIILDACRYDYFKKYNNILKGDLEKKLSSASCTYEWLEKNFKGKYFSDTVYVTANPRIHTDWFKKWILKDKNPFFHIEDVWRYAWNKKADTVTPKDMTKASMKMIEKYPSKKMIFHYLQPHPPYINSKDEKIIKSRLLNPLRRGEVSVEVAKEAYVKNLMLVLKEVKILIKNLKGRIVITADHGDCFGEWFLFSHPGKTYVKELVEIPWLTIKNEYNEQSRINIGVRKFIKKVKLSE